MGVKNIIETEAKRKGWNVVLKQRNYHLLKRKCIGYSG